MRTRSATTVDITANLAHAVSPIHVSVFWGVLVSVFAVCLAAHPFCPRLSRHLHAESSSGSTMQVLPLSYRFQMLRIYAGSNPAQMVDLHPFWNRSLEEFIGDAMSETRANRIPELTVSADSKRCSPKPTAAVRFGRDLLHESIQERSRRRAFSFHVLLFYPDLRGLA